MFMTYKNLAAATIAVTGCIFAGSNAMAQPHGGFGGGGFHGGGFHGGGFRGGGFRGGAGPAGMQRSFTPGGRRIAGGMTESRTFRNGDRGRDRHHHRDFDDGFVFFGDFGDPFYDYPYSNYGYYPYGSGYGSYDSYDQPVYQAGPRYSDSVVEQVQLRLARAGYYRGVIDGVSGNATRRAIREYERGHGLPPDGQIRGALLTKMGLG
jgi:hypothetical protein